MAILPHQAMLLKFVGVASPRLKRASAVCIRAFRLMTSICKASVHVESKKMKSLYAVVALLALSFQAVVAQDATASLSGCQSHGTVQCVHMSPLLISEFIS